MKKHHPALLVAIVFINSFAMAQDNTTIRSLSIFKNGQSFVVKDASVAATDGIYKMDKLPNALFGTYWFTGISGSINSVTSKMEDFVDKRERKANSFLELLHANKGMEITVNTNDNQSFKGIVEDFDLPEEINSKIQLQQLQLSNDYQGLYGFDRIFATAAPVLLLKMNGKWLSIDPSTIKSIEFPQKPSRTTVANIMVQKPIVTVHFDKAGKQDFRYMYLQRGISWTPVYKINLLSETEADLTLQAEVTNTVEDIKHTQVDFVVGVPNFSQATALATLLNYTNSPISYDENRVTQYNNGAMAKMALADVAVAPRTVNVSGSENEDLYFYSVKDMDIEKGERAQFPLFSQKVKIAHFYKCNLPASPFSNYRLNAESEEDADDEISDPDDDNLSAALTVGHYIELYNNSNTPFTSGAILMLKGKTDEVIAQDILHYTAKGSHSSVYVTEAPDIVVKEEERIASIKRASKKVDDYSYALMTIKGTVSVLNTKSKPAELKLNKSFTGKILNASVKYTTSVNNNNSRIGNTNQTLTLYTTIAPTEKKLITYTYQVYVRE